MDDLITSSSVPTTDTVGAESNINDAEEVISQLRVNNRLRRWHVTFGNPALGTYGGTIVTLHPRSRKPDASGSEEEDGNDLVSTQESYSSCSSLDSESQCENRFTQGSNGQKEMHRIAVMTNVPPHQVPDGVLNLVRGHRPFIQHVRILIGSSFVHDERRRRTRKWKRRQRQQAKNFQEQPLLSQHDLRRRSNTFTCNTSREHAVADSSFLATFTNVSLREEQDTLDISERVKRNTRSLSMETDAVDKSFQGDSFTQNDQDDADGWQEEKCERHHVEDDQNKKYHVLFVLDSEASAVSFVSDLHQRPYTTLDESQICSVHQVIFVEGENGVNLLGPFFASSRDDTASATSSSQHAIDEHQCPVCLDRMTLPSTSAMTSTMLVSSSILTTVCNHSFHIDCLARWQDSPCPVCRYDHSGLNETLSRCHICSTTLRNYVCLICGLVSCANGPTTTHSTIIENLDYTPPTQIPSQQGHALQHYEESLHAYALDTETQHVWDFAGGGYVHRLLQNEDGKIVEGTDPRLTNETWERDLFEADGDTSPRSAMERSTIPTYSTSAHDDEVLHRKLEDFAKQYYTLLKSQLEQQRIYYEGRLEAIRREYDCGTKSKSQTASDLISALKQERNQLEQRCTALRRKHKKVNDEVLFLKDMNESLEADRHTVRTQIANARVGLAEAKSLTRQLLTPLENKVNSLILKLTDDNSGTK